MKKFLKKERKNIITSKRAQELLLFASEQEEKGYHLACIGLKNIYWKCMRDNLNYDFDRNEYYK